MSIISSVQQLLNTPYTCLHKVEFIQLCLEHEVNNAFFEYLNKCINLKILNIVQTRVEKLDKICGLRGLKGLNLIKMDLIVVSELLYDMNAIQILRFDNNPNIIISNSIRKLNNLVTLSLLGCNLKMIPESIGNIHGLENLYLSYNQLTTIPDSIYELKKLQYFVVSHNKLTVLKSIDKLVSLRHLAFNNNLIYELPLDFGNSCISFNIITVHNKFRMCPKYFINNEYINIDASTYLSTTYLYYSCKVLPIKLACYEYRKKIFLNLPFALTCVKAEYYEKDRGRPKLSKVPYGCRIL